MQFNQALEYFEQNSERLQKEGKVLLGFVIHGDQTSCFELTQETHTPYAVYWSHCFPGGSHLDSGEFYDDDLDTLVENLTSLHPVVYEAVFVERDALLGTSCVPDEVLCKIAGDIEPYQAIQAMNAQYAQCLEQNIAALTP